MELSFDIMFFESGSDSYKRYGDSIRRLMATVLGINTSAITLQEKKEEHLYRGELSSNIFRFVGSVRVNRTLERKLLHLITEYCHRLHNTLIAFHSSVFNDFKLLRPWLRSVNTRPLHSLAFGTLVKLKKFVPHIRLADQNAEPELANTNDRWCKEVTAKFEHYRKRLLVEVMTDVHFRFVLDYSAINYIVISKVDAFWTIYLVLATPPLLYEVQKMRVQRRYNGLYPVQQEPVKEAETVEEENFEDEESNVKYTKVVRELRRTTIDDDIEPAVFSKSNVLELHPYERLKIDPHRYFQQIWEIVSNVNRYAKTPVYIGNIQPACGSIGDVQMSIPRNLPFDVHYAFQCLANASYQLHDELYQARCQRAFIEDVKNYSLTDAKATMQALIDLFWVKDNNIPVDSFYALKSRFTERSRLAEFEPRHDHLVEVRRCILTPTRTILLPPLPYQKSRLLRMSEPDNALRVYAKDDNLNELNFTVLVPGTKEHGEDFLLQNLLCKLILGIQVKDRKYDYLGSSTSQLRDIGMMFYARDDKNGSDANSIRQDIGDLSHINCPAKYIARLGQAFSQPIAYLENIDNRYVSVAPDVTGGMDPLTRKPYVFSDGVGRISKELAIDLSTLVDIERDPQYPFSAFQIRHAGSKGIVSVDPRLSGRQMVLRESMKKFESTLSSIEVVKVSAPRYVHLNRPFVNLLEQLGVDSSVFLTLARKEFQRIIDSFSCKCKALEVIKHYSILSLHFGQLRECPIDIFGEMYFKKILEAVIRDTIRLVKTHARIRLPEDYGRTMLGVLDETGILKEGQVFAQYSSFDNYRERKIATGEVLVTKFPCMHPGDVRKFKAVDIPELRHICDCLVFPQKGSRPHPDEMAGSDLDGDEYVIIWEKSFIFSRENHTAMLYPSGTAVNTVTQVGVGDMLQFYVDFIQKNNVGPLASAHLALSDQYESGIYHEDCILLAKLHPIALDYAKSGELDNQKSPRAHFYPDFMEKSETKPTYKSRRALGKLYRLSCLFEENAEFDSILEEKLCGNEKLLTISGWSLYAKQAEDAYNKYKSRILQIQRQFGIEDEMSLLGGVFTKMQKYVINKQERSDVLDMITMLLKGIRDEFRRLFMTGISDANPVAEKKKKMAKASAWYLVTRRMNEVNPQPYYGLPWIMSDVLSEIANVNSKLSVSKHLCYLKGYVEAVDNIPKVNPTTIAAVLRLWLHNNLETFRGFRYFRGVEKKTYDTILQPIATYLQRENTDRLDFAVQRVLKYLSRHLKSGDEFNNMLALTASMTLRRFRRTKKFVSFTQRLNTKDTEKDTWITCLSMRNAEFRTFVRKESRKFREKLKKSGVEDVCCHVAENDKPEYSLLFVSAFGTIESLKKLRNALTRFEFYEEVVNQTSLKFD